MRKIVDIRYQYRGAVMDSAVCRLRIFEDEVGARPPVVVVSELAENPNTNVADIAEYLAAEVLEEFLLMRGGEAVPFIWVEHHAYRHGIRAGDADYVRFEHYRAEDCQLRGHRRRRIGAPTRFPAPRSEVEALVGEPLDAPEVAV
jgi:hypothetical protein